MRPGKSGTRRLPPSVSTRRYPRFSRSVARSAFLAWRICSRVQGGVTRGWSDAMYLVVGQGRKRLLPICEPYRRGAEARSIPPDRETGVALLAHIRREVRRDYGKLVSRVLRIAARAMIFGVHWRPEALPRPCAARPCPGRGAVSLRRRLPVKPTGRSRHRWLASSSKL
jgi:hypothetical protein